MTTGNDLFILDPNNRDVAKGTTRYKRQTGLALLVLGFVVLCCFPLSIAFTVDNWNTYTRLRDAGITVPATVVDRYTSGTGDDTSYHMVYEFPYTLSNGEPGTQQQTESISFREYEALEIGQQFEVVYDPENPERSIIGQPDMGEPIGTTAITLVLMLFGSLLGLGAWLELQRERRMERRGQLIHGEITRITGDTDSDGDFLVDLHYRFIAPDGRVISGNHNAIANNFANQPLPPTGTLVAIWYVDDKNYKLL